MSYCDEESNSSLSYTNDKQNM